MSRRYGRKQKRAARAQIAELEKGSIQLHDMFIREARRRREFSDKADFLMDKIRLWDDEIRGLLGPYTSFAIDDTTFHVEHMDQVRQLPVLPPRLTAVGPFDMRMDEISYYVATMLSFISGLQENDLDRLRHLLTLRVVGGRPESAHYAVSEQMWHELKLAPPDAWRRMTVRIAGDMIRLLAEANDPAKRKRA